MKNKLLLLVSLLLLTPYIYSQNFNGIWQSEGYGEILDISANSADLYQVTSISNVFDETINLNGNQLGTGEDLVGDLSLSGDQLILTLTGGTVKIFNKLNTLPAVTPNTNDPLTNFNIFWQTYEEQCALFPILNIDWQAEHDLYAAQINVSTSGDQLFSFMSQMLAKLNDGHSYLDDEDDNDRYFEGGPDVGDLWLEYQEEMMDLIEDEYIDGGDYEYSETEQITYGIINDSIGYLAVNSMDDYAPNGNELDDNAVFSSELDIALNFLQNTKALILDVRFNFGGFDSNSRLLANRLTTENQPVYSKQARVGAYDEFAELTTFNIQPEGVQYVGRPVVVLTSSGTISAADVFAMMASEIACVTLMGEPTYGVFSDNYTKYLPNGWDFGISPERYLTVGGTDYEQQGFPPDIEVIGSMAAFNNDSDNILEAAILEVGKGCNLTSTTDIGLKNSFWIYPNPADDMLAVNLGLAAPAKIEWVVSDALGSPVLHSEKQGTQGENRFWINTDSLANGMYFLQMKNGGNRVALRFSVLR